MNAVIYNVNNYKIINGTAFYCFEYFLFLKQFIQVKLIFTNCDKSTFEYYLKIFEEKYNFNINNDDFICAKRTDLLRFNLKKILILDIITLTKIKEFISSESIAKFIYSNDTHDFKGKLKNSTFYGFYDYQVFNKKNRLKIYKEVHKTFEKGNKQLLSSLNYDLSLVVSELNLDITKTILKTNNSHNFNLFSQINKIIYYHSPALDKNNRLIVESFIHGLELEVYFNGYLNDSVFERYNLIKNNKVHELFLTPSDLLIKDFIEK